MTILSDIQLLEPGAKVVLYSLDTTSIGGILYRFHGYPQQGSIFWQGNEYIPWSIMDSGFAKEGVNQQPTPTLSVGNIGKDSLGNPVPGYISALCLLLNDMVGAILTRHITLGQYLDAVNFTGGNASADPAQEFTPEVFYVEQKTSETSEQVEFQLTSALDFQGQMLPARQIISNACSWLRMGGGYRGALCGYTGTNYFDVNNNPVSNPALDVCNGTLAACTIRFGAGNNLRYGSFPAAGLIGN